jgi:membrane protein implicated in regulation of membrane protease activity
MKSKRAYFLFTGLFLSLALVVSLGVLSPVWVAFSLFAICMLVLLGLGWISKKETRPEQLNRN